MNFELSLGFEDVAIRQQKGIVQHRSDVDISSEVIKGVILKIPLIASCMSTVTNANFCNLLSANGALGIMHRAWKDNNDYINECKKLTGEWRAAAIGISGNDFELANMLVKVGINILVVDVAHGYTDWVIEFGKKIKIAHPNIKLVLGNTNNIGLLLETKSFVDGIRCGVSNGAICQTSNMTGCQEKQFSVVYKFKRVSKEYSIPILSDGGVREASDLCKAIGACANSCIAGKIFAACPESAAPVVPNTNSSKKLYAGQASRFVQENWLGTIKNNCTEGKIEYLEIGESVDKLLQRYAGALRSGISYAGGKDIKSFQESVDFVRLA
ncbi:IMP dehydrogenase [Candidatus Pacearchaeota archaeon]|nr:IMP dehydrogenase [Candidatus Pacearchaeota archaeon]